MGDHARRQRIVVKHGPSRWLGPVWRAKVEERRWWGWTRASYPGRNQLVRVGMSVRSPEEAVSHALSLLEDPDFPQDIGTPSLGDDPTWERQVVYL